MFPRALVLWLVVSVSALAEPLTAGLHTPRAWSGKVQTVVSVTLMTDELMAALLPTSRILAYSRSADDLIFSNVIDAAKLVPGRAWLNLEVVLSFHPDVVLAADWSDASSLQFLLSHGIAIEIVAAPRHWSQVLANLRQVGVDLGVTERSGAVLAQLTAQTAELKRRCLSVEKTATVLEYNAWGTSMGSQTLWNDLATMAGLKNLAEGFAADEYGSVPMTAEELLRLDPDWLVVPSSQAAKAYQQADLLAKLRTDPVYSLLKAVKEGHLLTLPESWKTSTSQDSLKAAWALQNAAYPNLR